MEQDLLSGFDLLWSGFGFSIIIFVVVFFILWFILWFLLPFAVFGVKERLDKLIQQNDQLISLLKSNR